jgi:hypothetical protein
VDASTDQLMQAMAGFSGGGAPEVSNAILPDVSQPFATASQQRSGGSTIASGYGDPGDRPQLPFILHRQRR